MPASPIDLEFQHVSKYYKIRQESSGEPIGGAVGRTWRKLFPPSTVFRATDDVSFQVARGEAVGIIGHNGAGKSTILKLLSNITTPTSGEIRIQGRIASLLEVGSGFHPDLTGRENIYLSGSILGMSRSEISKKLEAIVDFAQVRPFIDVPVKRYSSGMFVRLGFSIAAHLEPDILLLDEVLAVGDAAFQERCLSRIEELRRQNITIVFISHDLNAVQRLCQRVLLMQRGKLVFDGKAHEAIVKYMEGARFQASPRLSSFSIPGHITGVTLLNGEGAQKFAFKTGSELRLRVDLTVDTPISSTVISLCVLDLTRQLVCEFTTAGEKLSLEPGNHTIDFCCAELNLQPGVYNIDAAMEDMESFQDPDWQRECASLYVERGKTFRGIFYTPHSWTLKRVTKNSTGQSMQSKLIQERP
jgi:lipopolysaccharide transport system ATP-binding protein